MIIFESRDYFFLKEQLLGEFIRGSVGGVQ